WNSRWFCSPMTWICSRVLTGSWSSMPVGWSSTANRTPLSSTTRSSWTPFPTPRGRSGEYGRPVCTRWRCVVPAAGVVQTPFPVGGGYRADRGGRSSGRGRGPGGGFRAVPVDGVVAAPRGPDGAGAVAVPGGDRSVSGPVRGLADGCAGVCADRGAGAAGQCRHAHHPGAGDARPVPEDGGTVAVLRRQSRACGTGVGVDGAFHPDGGAGVDRRTGRVSGPRVGRAPLPVGGAGDRAVAAYGRGHWRGGGGAGGRRGGWGGLRGSAC